METIIVHDKGGNFWKSKSIQILLTLGTAILFISVLLKKFKRSRSKLMIRKRKKALESNMWAID